MHHHYQKKLNHSLNAMMKSSSFPLPSRVLVESHALSRWHNQGFHSDIACLVPEVTYDGARSGALDLTYEDQG